MRKLKLLFASLAMIVGSGTTWAQMTDVTSTYINNPGFETDAAASDLTGSSTQNTPTGWTVSPSSLSNTQWGTANSSTTIQGNSTSQAPSAGDNYFYFRDNWQSGTNISVKQESKTELPAGNYVIYLDVFTYSTNGTQPVYTFTVSDGTNTYVNGSITANKKAWTTYYYQFKLDAAATLTFSANMTPKAAASGKHDWMLIDNVKLLKADNPAEPVANNTTDLYLYNEKTKQFLSGGMNWGTQAICDNYGQELTATLSDGKYTLKTQQYNKNLGPDFYLDNGTAAKLLFLETAEGSGKYYITQDGINFLTSNGAGQALLTNVTTPTDASVWTIVNKADRKAALSSSTVDNPGNATFLIGDANFSRNCLTTPWTMEASNQNLSGGEDGNGGIGNHCAESYRSTFTLSQTLSSMPVGTYGLVAQGFYRQDGSDNENLPYFYIADQKGTFPSRTGSEGSMNAASASFTEGKYTIDPIYYRLDAEGAITLGAKLETNTMLWCIFDNFQLYYYGDVSVAAVKMKASVDAYNDAMDAAKAFTEASMFADAWTTLQDAITDNTLDLNDPALTESALTTATTNLVAANTAATAAVAKKTTYNTAVTLINGGTNVDLTSLIVNNGFENGNTDGWTNSGNITAGAQGNKAFDNTQDNYYAERWHAAGTIDLNQTVTALPAGIYKVEAYMYSDATAKLYANSTEVSVSTSQKYSVTVEIADKGSIKFGGYCELTNSTWVCMDEFALTYLGTIDDLTYTLATGKMGTDKAEAQTAAETAFLANKNLANYNALLAAIAAAEASGANYTALKNAIDKAENVKAANNFVTEEATTALESEISTATSAWTDVSYTDAQATAEIAVLGSAVSGWHAIASEGKAGAYLASAWSKTSENWWDAPYINTWSTEGDNDGSGFSVPFFEYYTENNQNLAANTFTATLTGLANGCYDVEVWARVQRRSDADFNGDGSMITMSVNDGTAVSIMDNTSNNVGSGTSVMRLGRYTARGMVTDGTLTLSINVKLGSNVHWLSWRDVKYNKVADETVTITAAGYATYCSENALDFLGTGIKAYTATATDKTVMFHEVEGGKIAGNNGLLLKGAEGTYQVPVTVSDNNPANTLAGVLTDTSVDAGIFVLMNGAKGVGFYKTTTAFTVGANTAYLPASVAASRMFIGFDDEEEVTGIEGITVQKAVSDKLYNLNGQRVNKAQKGLFIKNGKKYVK